MPGLINERNLPTNWAMKRFKYCAQICNGGEYSDVEVEEGGYPVIGSGGEFARASKFSYYGKSVLLGRKGTVDKPLFVDGAFWCVDTMFYTKINDSMYEKYLYYCALCFPFDYYVTSTALPSMTQRDLGSQEITVPPRKEQQAIADFLDKECVQIDSVAADLEKQIALLQQYKKSLITETVTKGLDKSVPMKDSGVEWIGQIASSNYICRLKYLTIIKDGTHDTPAYVDEAEDTYPLITSKHIDYKTKQINFSSANHISKSDFEAIYKRSDVEYGDIIMPMIGTIGNPVIINTHKKFAIKNVALFKTGFDLVQAKYIFYQFYSNFLSEQFSLMSRGGVQSFVSLEVLENLIFVDCNQDQKKRIVKYLDATCEQVDELIIGKQNQLSIIQQHKQSLIYEYVTGKKRVKEVQ